MIRGLWVLAVGGILAAASAAGAQEPGGLSAPLVLNGSGPYYQPPGSYGTSYGVPSYGVPRLFTAFASPYGAGYGYGYAPYVDSLNWNRLMGGPGGQGSSGYTVPGYFQGGSTYNTFPAPYTVRGPESPPIGVYAPTFGPPSFTTR